MWLSIQIQIHFSKWIDNPIQIQSQSRNFKKNSMTVNFESFILQLKHVIPKGDLLINWQPNIKTLFLDQNSLAFLMKHYASLYLNLMKKLWTFFGFGLKWENWIDNPNPKSNFEFGLSITIQSTTLDCNPNWAIQQSNPAIPCLFHSTYCLVSVGTHVATRSISWIPLL